MLHLHKPGNERREIFWVNRDFDWHEKMLQPEAFLKGCQKLETNVNTVLWTLLPKAIMAWTEI